MSFSFSFSGDDIEEDGCNPLAPHLPSESVSTAAPSAFPVQGKPQLPPTRHALSDLLARLPSKIAYGLLDITLDGNDTGPDGAVAIGLPRRELWDVRVQLMAEDDDDDDDHRGAANGDRLGGLGDSDVKTGVYEGGFKSWESSVDLVKVLLGGRVGSLAGDPVTGTGVVELGCGTALPSLALFQQAMTRPTAARGPLVLALADYNPSVLRLVTLPNLILTWALHRRAALGEEAFLLDGEVELLPSLLDRFASDLHDNRITLLFYSGGWDAELAGMVQTDLADAARPTQGARAQGPGNLLVLGAETIYSPFALKAFADMVFRLMRGAAEERQKQTERCGGTETGTVAGVGVLVAAKRLYFGVGGSLDDFVDLARAMGAVVTGLREETQGVRRGVVQCVLPAAGGRI